jgi:hypothetical protein
MSTEDELEKSGAASEETAFVAREGGILPEVRLS